MDNVTARERELWIDWLKTDPSSVESKSDSTNDGYVKQKHFLGDEIVHYLFTTRMFDATPTLPISGLYCLLRFFFLVNQQENKIAAIGRKGGLATNSGIPGVADFEVLDIDLLGMDTIWNVVLHSRFPYVAKVCSSNHFPHKFTFRLPFFKKKKILVFS